MVPAALAVVVLLLAAFSGWRWSARPDPAAHPPAEAAPAAESPVPTPIAAPLVDAPAPGGELREVVAADATGFNPILTSDPTGSRVIDLIYPRLVGQDPTQGFPVPTELAARWAVSPDGLTYTFALRAGVQWSDGVPVTAADVKFTYDALANERVQSPYRDRAAAIARIETPDDQTVVVTLHSPA